MELFSVSLRGFRRFRNATTLRTNGKLVALVGPNEAGKSTILAALKRLDDGKPVPGLSSVARSLAPILPTEADNVAFLIDGDDGGRKIAKALADGGIPPGRIVVVEGLGRKALLLEDFVDPGLLLEALNAIVARHFPTASLLSNGALSNDHRMRGLEAAFEASTGRRIDKVELAYQVIELLDADPRRAILDRRRKSDFARIARTVSAAVNPTPPRDQP